MKIPSIAIVLLAIGSVGLRAQTPTTAASQGNVPAPTDYQIVQQDGNSRVWQREIYEKGPDGQIVARPHEFTELATGLNYKDSSGQWQPSKEEIDIQPDGTLAATQGQHQVYFPGNIYGGEIELVQPDGVHLHSCPVGLSYDDGSNTMLIAVLTNSIGQLIGSNQVIYTNAFVGLDADLLYTYTKAGLEQDIVLREQPPTPASLNLNPETARLQVLTEFLNPPKPRRTTSTLPEQAGLVLTDDTLDFGTMQMVPGKAFKLGEDSPPARVGKSWVTLQGRQFLVEAVPVAALAEQLDSLPASSAQTTSTAKARVISRNLVLPPQHLAKAGAQPLKLARTGTSRKPGVVLDYVYVNTSLTNYTFQGDSTYYISGTTYGYYGTYTFEGGAVIKYGTGGACSINVSAPTGQVNWLASAYRPVIFTAIDDNSVGETINGSTGDPTGFYAEPALSFSGVSVNLSNFRISYAKIGIAFDNNGEQTNNLSDGQIINGYDGIKIFHSNVNIRNMLFHDGYRDFAQLDDATNDTENTTFCNSSLVPGLLSSGSMTFENCLFANVTYVDVDALSITGVNNGFYDTTMFGADQVTNNFYPFQTVGGGEYYLTNGCGFHNAGTTNIDPVLLADLAAKTTYPPLMYSNVVVSTNLTLSPQVPRDTNSAPDLGYHYDPIDYLCGEVYVTNATLTVSPGTVVGCFGIYPDNSWYSLGFDGGAQFLSQGEAGNPVRIVEYATVQESWPGPDWCHGTSTAHSGFYMLTDWVQNFNMGAVINCRFTDASCVGLDTSFEFFNDSPPINLRDSEFDEQIMEISDITLNLTNCLFNRAEIVCFTLNPSIMRNNLFYGGAFEFYADSSAGTNSAIQDNDFDKSEWVVLPNWINVGYNAYVDCTNGHEIYGTGDIILTNLIAYETGPLGTFYQPTDSPLIHMGSTNANLLGLYHYTVTTNQVIEGTNTVSIGYHYVATDDNGNPLDSNGDGVPDYLEDPLGNGLPYGGTNWALAILTEPASQTVTQGNSATFLVTASGVAPLNYQWYFGSVALANATNTALTTNNVQMYNGGDYYVVVSDGFGSVTSSVAVLTVVTAPPVPALAIGGERIMELNTNGNVLSWGGNEFGELGDYTYLDSTNIVVAVGLTNIVKIASSVNYSLAIDATGQLWTWGQLDQVDGTNLPVVISGMTNIIAIAAHDDQFFGGVSNKRLDPKTEYALSDPAAAVKSDGTVWMWGSSFCDDYGPTPVQIIGISNVIAVAMENCQVYAVTTNGDVWSWGNGNNTPTQMVGLSNIVSICGGDIHMLALDANGQLWAWGDNELGELGDGYAESSSSNPILVPGMTNVTEIAAGASDSLALDASGRVWSWGGNHSNGYSEQTVGSPTQIMVISNAIAIAAGSDALAAITADGTVWQWGASDSDNSSWSWGSGVGAENPQLAPTYFDFYQGQLPTLTITNGNDQVISGNAESLNPLSFLVTDTNGLVLTNAPVSVEVVYGDIELRTNSGGANFKGLRLNSDNNGLVSLIAYADDAPVNLNCLIRVLAASKAQIREVDFTETLAPSPTIDITNPVNGAVILIGTNQPLAINVDAEPADGAFIQEVDYSFGTNGTADTSLGISTVTPYAFSWTNTLWWSNDFVGQYTISAVAVDNFGGRSDPSSINITVALDADGNGLPDYWEVEYFGTNGVDPNSSPDGNGQSILYDYQNGLSPTDYYNGVLPQLEIAGGNDQDGCANSFLPQPVAVKALKSVYSNFVQVLTNAPIVFTVTNGTALFATTTNDIPTNSLATHTDSNGVATVWVYFPPTTTTPPDSTILATAFSGSNSVSTTINEFKPMGHWTFNDTNTWIGEGGQLPLLTNNLTGISDWSSNAVVIDNTNIALLAYNIVETNGVTNLTLNTGSIRFWFRPDWSSTNLGGNGPGAWGKLFQVGSYSPSLTNGWWSLYVDPSGTKISFATATNGFSTKNLTGNISWYSNEWYQIALTYSPTNSAVYVDGSILASGAGVSYWPNANELTNGFRIGIDENGTNQAAGTFDELETFNYSLSASNSYTHQTDLPDWWEVEYFDQTGLVPDSQPGNNGYNLLYSYSQGDDPNVITFSLYSSPYVNTNVAPLSIANLTGIPSSIAVMVDYNNNFATSITNLHLTSLDFSNAVWQPFDTNISASLADGDGAYDIFVGMRGPAPNATVTWESIHVILGTVPPIITVTNPVSSTASRPMIQLQGYANETLGSLTYDLSNAVEVLTNQSGFLTAQFYDTNVMGFTTNYFQCYDLMVTTNGPNVITLHATDLAGNTSTTNISVTVDYGLNTNPPSLQIFWPTNGTVVAGTSCNLSGLISDPTATLTASLIDTNDSTNVFPAVVERSGLLFDNGVQLDEGTNIITLTATDVLGNITTSNIVVIADDTGLVVNPIPDGELNQTNVTITGSVGDPTDQVTVNGVPATVNVDGTWEADGVSVSDTGTASIGVQVSDAFGNPVASQNNSQDQPSTVAIQSVHGQFSSNYSSPLSGNYEPLSTDDVIFLSNGEDSLDWNYQSGGYDVGYDYYKIIYWYGTIAPNYSDYNNFVPPGNVFPGNFVGADLNDGGWQTSAGAQSKLLGSQGGLTTTLATSVSTQTKIMIVPSGQGAVGGTTTYIVAAQVVDTDNNQQLPASAVKFKNQMPGSSTADVTNCDGSIWTEGLISGPSGANVEVTPIAAGNISFNNIRHVKSIQDWQQAVYNEIAVEPGGVNVEYYYSASSFTYNRPYIKAVYAFYQNIFLERPNWYYWAGLAKLAGAPVYAGLSDAQNASSLVPIRSFQSTLMQMNIDVMNDLAWQFEAYRKGGLPALEAISAVTPLATTFDIAPWLEIDQGIQQNNQALILQGNEDLLQREQQQVLASGYNILNSMIGITTLMSIFAECPVWDPNPTASDYDEPYYGRGFFSVSSGSIANFSDRWAWITAPTVGILDTWIDLSSADKVSEVSVLLTNRAVTYSLLSPTLFYW